LISDCSPAGGRVAAFDFAKRRHVPLAALTTNTIRNAVPVV
jgi:hypothetical protein